MQLFTSKSHIDLIVGYFKRGKHKALIAESTNILLHKDFGVACWCSKKILGSSFKLCPTGAFQSGVCNLFQQSKDM